MPVQVDRRYNTGIEGEESGAKRVVQLSLRVADGGGESGREGRREMIQ